MASSRVGFRFASRQSYDSHDTSDGDEEAAASDLDVEEKEKEPLQPYSCTSMWRLICFNVVPHGVTPATPLSALPIGAAGATPCGLGVQLGVVLCLVAVVCWSLPLALTEPWDEGHAKAGLVYGLLAFAVRQLVLSPLADLAKYPIYRFVGGLRDASTAEARAARHGRRAHTLCTLSPPLRVYCACMDGVCTVCCAVHRRAGRGVSGASQRSSSLRWSTARHGCARWTCSTAASAGCSRQRRST